ncbi:MAG: VWA domain-containing protein [Caulobacteraceae bacterium]|nr:VWA domain-containing protein [Caulobacteraceae bacterium]
MSLRKALALSAIGLSLVGSPVSVSAQPEAQRSDDGLCRRAPSPVVLPPERERRREILRSEHSPAPEMRVPPPDLSAPPSPTPLPVIVDPSPSAAYEESIVVTGSRLARSDFESISPITTAGSELELTATPTDEADPDRGSAFRHRDRRAPEPEAGLLTAGDHDDLLNPELYARYVDTFLESEALEGVPRVDTRRVLTVKVEDRAGRALPFAHVTLTCGDGNQLTLATTADGTAVFFPELDRLGSRVSVSANYRGRRTPMSESVSLSRSGEAQEVAISVDASASPIRNFDLAIVVDATGSMSDELEYLKAELGSIVGDLREDHPDLDIRIGLVAYRDTDDDFVTRTFPLTGDISSMQGNLAQQRAGGGGDYPEAVEQAMARAVALNWRENAVRSILFVADAPPHADDIATTWRSAEVARSKRIQIVPVGASGVGPGAEYVMRAMAAVTQSRYIFLTDDSGIGNPHAPPTVDCYLVTSLESLIQRTLDSQISGRRVEPDQAEVIRAVGRYDRGRCRGSAAAN